MAAVTVGLRLVAALVSAGLLVAILGCDPGGPGTGTTSTTTATTPESASPAAPQPRAADPTGATTASPESPRPRAPVPPSPQPPFRAEVAAVDAADLSDSWHPGCPVDLEELRMVEVTHWGYDGKVHTGRLVVLAELTDSVRAVMGELYTDRFPIERMSPVEAYDGDDDVSMAANNTSAFNCREVTGGQTWSEHAYGRAIDVNPLVNPYVAGDVVAPPAGVAYLDRDGPGTGFIRAGDATVAAFARHGWHWGGAWDSPTDYQHFSTTNR